MEEIIDLEETVAIDDDLKEFMKKDDECEKLLNEKIDELSKEEKKLSDKEKEIKDLEESNREKINSESSADELIEIAGKIKEAEAELSSIKENIEKLLSEKEELSETKRNIEDSKMEYIKTLNKTNSEYEEQLKKISEAIEVCDNPTLKQVLKDVQLKKDEELNEIEKKRINELKTVLKEEEEVPEEKEETPVVEVKNEPEVNAELNIDNIELPKVEETPIVEPIVLDEPSIEVKSEEPTVEVNTDLNIANTELPKVEETPVVEPLYKEDNEVINIDSILNNDVQDNTDSNLNIDLTPDVTPDLNVITPDNLVVPEVNTTQTDIQNEEKIRIIYERDIPNALLKDIYSSSKIMPGLYSYLEDKNIVEGSFN